MTPVAAVAWVSAVTVFVVLQRFGRRLRKREKSEWWASNARDVLNFAGLFALVGAFVVAGFPVRLAVLLGGVLTLSLAALERLTAQVRRHELLVAFAGVLAGIALLPFTHEVERIAEAALRALAGEAGQP